MSNKQTAESFWAKVDMQSRTKCWKWVGACNNTGYGTVAWHGSTFTAHRVAAWLTGMISSPRAPASKKDKTHVLHKCDNRKCCNPDHFFLGSYSDNQKDCYKKKRRQAFKGETHANSKLTNRQAEEIRTRYAAGDILQKTLAEKYGVSNRVIRLIVMGESYT